jgi:hypothetical protein
MPIKTFYCQMPKIGVGLYSSAFLLQGTLQTKPFSAVAKTYDS